MSNNAAVFARMRRAAIPPHTFDTSLRSLGQEALATAISTKSFELSESESISYLLRPSDRKGAPSVTKVASVLAKELVLLKKAVYYSMLAELVDLTKDTALRPDGGYIVVGDLGENITRLPLGIWDQVESVLMQHIRRGGSLVLGDTGAVSSGLFGSDMLDALTAFEEIQIR